MEPRPRGYARDLGYSQQDVADKAKCSKTTIERLERGITVDYQTIHQVAAVLEVGFKDLLHQEEQGAAGTAADFVPLNPVKSGRELMNFICGCDRLLFDIEDMPEAEQVQAVTDVIRRFQPCLPGTQQTNNVLLRRWNSSAADRLEGVGWLDGIMSEMAGLRMHLLAGTYMGSMSMAEAQVAAQDFVDEMEFTGHQLSDFDPRLRIVLLRATSCDRKQLRVKVDDMLNENPAAPTEAATMPESDDLPF